MKTIHYFLLFCWLMFAVSCKTANVEPAKEEPAAEEPAAEEPAEEEPAAEEPVISLEVSFQPEWDGKRPTDSWIYSTTSMIDDPPDGMWDDAFQVPSNVLVQMSTQAVIQAIIDYPFLSGLYLGSEWSFQFHFEIMFTDLVHPKAINAYTELCKREDAGKALLDRLLLTDPITVPSVPPPFLSQTIELMLSQTIFLVQVKEHSGDIVRLALRNDELRRKDEMWDSTNGITLARQASETMTPLLMGRTIFVSGYAPFLEAVNSNILMKSFLEGRYPLGYFANAPDEAYPVTYYPSLELYALHPVIFEYSKKYLTNK